MNLPNRMDRTIRLLWISVVSSIRDEGQQDGSSFPPHGRIPDFAGAETAAERLADTDTWADATVVESNPDAPQLAGGTPDAPRGRDRERGGARAPGERCFLELDPHDADAAATISRDPGARALSVRTSPPAYP